MTQHVVIQHVTGPTATERFGAVTGGLVSAVERRMLRKARHISLSAEWGKAQVGPLAPEAELHLVGAGGEPAAFTGASCIGWCGHLTGADFSVNGGLHMG